MALTTAAAIRDRIAVLIEAITPDVLAADPFLRHRDEGDFRGWVDVNPAASLRRFQVRAMTGPLPADPRLALGQLESMTYLRNQLLRDSDWASMAHGVELRTPLVDAYLLQQLQPLLGNFHRFPNKRLLAQAPNKPLPEAIITRRKTGFGIPVARWLAEAGMGAGSGSRSWAVEVARRQGWVHA